MRYGQEVVLMTLDELGVDLLDGDDSGWHSAFCPLHDNTVTPAFRVHVEEGAWKCFGGCGSSGDLAELVSKLTGEEVRQARRRLRMSIPSDPETIKRILMGRPREASEVRKAEPLFYERGRVPRYLVEERGFDVEFLRKWEAGYDRDLHAAVVPVRDASGKLVGLVRRVLPPNDSQGKYRNTAGLSKHGVLFGLDKVPPGERSVVVVEGPLDCMWLHQHGIPAVAVLGSSMSREQAELLARRFWKVVLAFDFDAAGAKALLESAERLSKLELHTIRLPRGFKDVQELSPKLLERVFTQARSLLYDALRPESSAPSEGQETLPPT